MVDVKKFLKTYCPTPRCKYVFKLLWKEYTELIIQREKDQVDKTPVMTNLLSDAKNSVDHLTFACYLLFFMTLESDEISGFVFWLYFRSKGAKKEFEVNQTRLIELAQLLGKSKKDYEKKMLKKRIKALEKLTKTIDPATFKRGKFHLLDLKCGQPFSKPIMDIHKEIKSKFMSTVIWQRVSKCIHTTLQDLLPAKKRLIDPKNTLTYTHYKNTGERKRARKELAPYVKLISEFSTYLISDDDTLNVKKTSIFSFLFGWIWKLGGEKKVTPTITTNESVDGKDGDEESKNQNENQKHVYNKKPKIDHLDLTAMTYRYRKQMKLPIDVVYDDADQKREMAEELLLQCEEDVLSGDEILAKAAARIRKHAGDDSDDDSYGDDIDDDELNDMMSQFDVKLDEHGEVVLDEDGQPVLVRKESINDENDGTGDGDGDGDAATADSDAAANANANDNDNDNNDDDGGGANGAGVQVVPEESNV